MLVQHMVQHMQHMVRHMLHVLLFFHSCRFHHSNEGRERVNAVCVCVCAYVEGLSTGFEAMITAMMTPRIIVMTRVAMLGSDVTEIGLLSRMPSIKIATRPGFLYNIVEYK